MPNLPTSLTPAFKLVFVATLGTMFVSLVVCVYLVSAFPTPSDQVKSLVETCSTTWKLGCGAVFGLLGGKAL